MLQRFTSRKFLLAFAGQIAGLLVLFWPEHESEIVTASQYIAGLLVMGLTAYGFMKSEAVVDATRVQGEQQLNQLHAQRDAVVGDLREENERIKRKLMEANIPYPALIVGLLCLGLVACNTTPGGYTLQSPEGQYDIAQESFTGAVKVLTTAKRVGEIDQATWDNQVMPAIREGDRVLDAWLSAVLAGEPVQVHLVAWDTVRAALQRWVDRVEGSVSDADSSVGDPGPGSARGDGLGAPGVQGVREAGAAGLPGEAGTGPQAGDRGCRGRILGTPAGVAPALWAAAA